AARLSPVKLTRSLTEEEVQRLFDATQRTLLEWAERLRREAGERFPEKVTAFHEGMAVHGRYGKPCPACGAPIARIIYADNETNYCARCQTGGRPLSAPAPVRPGPGDRPLPLRGGEELHPRPAGRPPPVARALASFRRRVPEGEHHPARQRLARRPP